MTFFKVIFYLLIIRILFALIRMLASVKINNANKKDDNIIDVDYEEVE